jgi:uncharacterized membrane protein
MKTELSIVIDQPPPVVFDFLMDPENLPLWVTNFQKIEHEKGEPGELGAISKVTFHERGREIEFTEEIIALRQNELVTVHDTGNDMEMKATYRLEPISDSSTLLSTHVETTVKSFLMKLFFFFSRQSMLQRQKSDLDKLKNAIEELTDIE